MGRRIAFAFVLAAAVAAVASTWQRGVEGTKSDASGRVTYDQLMRDYPVARRYTLFTEQLSPAKKAELMGIHYSRCLAALGPTLTDEQRAIIRDAQSAISPAAYEVPPEPAANAKMEAVERRAQSAFPSELGVQIFTLWSECKRP